MHKCKWCDKSGIGAPNKGSDTYNEWGVKQDAKYFESYCKGHKYLAERGRAYRKTYTPKGKTWQRTKELL